MPTGSRQVQLIEPVSTTVTRRSKPKQGFRDWRTAKPMTFGFVEPMTGIEPAYSAWEADVLPLNYIGIPGYAGDHEG